MNTLDIKINKHFEGLVVRKDIVKAVRGNAIVPGYVLEYLLGQYCATSDEDSINSGIDTVKGILANHYVHRNEANLIKSVIKEKGRHKVIDKISVELNDKSDNYEATFSNLGIKKIIVDSDTVKKNPKLLVGGVWCLAELEYIYAEETGNIPWIMTSLKPIQMSHFNFEEYIKARKEFTTDEWIDLLLQSIGFNPELFGRRTKLLQLVRLIPYCERNYNLIELGPKGTGKSHIYSEFSPHGILISGGEITVAKLFVNNSNSRVGLVGYWDTVAFDEFAGKKKTVDKALVDIMKNYMANKSFSRGIETLGADASMAFIGNTQHTVPYMLKHSDLFCELPEKYYDSAFLDRLHFYIPGWEIDIIRGEMFSSGYGFVVDYLAEILRYLRNQDYSHKYKDHFELLGDISTRDRDGINKTFSGLMKILFPDGEETLEEVEEILRFSIEGRKRVKDQLMRIDTTYPKVQFGFTKKADNKVEPVYCLEEKQFSNIYKINPDGNNSQKEDDVVVTEEAPASASPVETLQEKQLTFQENQRGVSFDKLFGPYLKGALKITVTDPYIRIYHQARNFIEFCETIGRFKKEDEEVILHLSTVLDDDKFSKQNEYLEKIEESCLSMGINLSWDFKADHVRHIITDHGWKILLDRGLDIFQRYESNDAFDVTNRMQEQRAVKSFEVTFMRMEKVE